jgi:hypothetical protein
MATSSAGPPHFPTGTSTNVIAVLPAKDCVEPTSYRDALFSAEPTEWDAAMQLELDSLMANGTWELVNLREGHEVVNNMRIHNIK